MNIDYRKQKVAQKHKLNSLEPAQKMQGSQQPMVQSQENRQDTSGEKIRNFRKNQDIINRF